MLTLIKGWVVIATTTETGRQLTRNEYITYCHQNNKVMIQTLDMGNYWIYGVFSLLQSKNDGILCDLTFPQAAGDPSGQIYGSMVLAYICDYNQGYECFAIRDENNNFALTEESMIRLLKTKNSSIAGIDLYGKGLIDIFTTGEESELNIRILNNNQTAETNIKTNIFNLFSQYSNTIIQKKIELIIKDYTTDKLITTIKYEKGIGFSFVDEFENSIIQDIDKLELLHKKAVIIGSGEEPAVLGNQLKTILSDFVDKLTTQIRAITVTVASFGAPSTPPINEAVIKAVATEFKSQLDNFKSTYLTIQ